MKETFYFSHDYNARDDEKILHMVSEMWMEWYWLYWWIVEILAINEWKFNLNTQWIAYKFRIDNKLITQLLHNYNLFIIDEEEWIFYNARLLEHFEKRSKQKERKSAAWKKWMAKRWGNNNTVITENNTTITNDNKVKESKVKESKVNNIISKDITTEVEVFWNENINKMQEHIKKTIEDTWRIYKAWKYERMRIKNILTWKEFWEVCEKAKMSRKDFVFNIINLAWKLKYSKSINNWADLYSNYAAVYNKWLEAKHELLETKILREIW